MLRLSHLLRSALLVAALGTVLAGCRSADTNADSPPDEQDQQGEPWFKFGLASLPRPRIPRVFKISIQQGNVITQRMVDRLEPGMTKRQVIFVLGEPVIDNPFRHDTWEYVHTFKPPNQPMIVSHMTLYFDGDVLESFTGDLKPSGTPGAAPAG